jgi:hypothetical protein
MYRESIKMLLQKENHYVIKGSAGMKKRMKYDGTDKYI